MNTLTTQVQNEQGGGASQAPAVDPSAVDPSAVDPSAVDPSAVDPSAVDPLAVDPYLWLEDVGGERALAWVGERNAQALAELQGQPGYPALFERLRTILNDKQRIAYASKQGDYVYNFWRDADHVRGIWRRTSLDDYCQAQPHWDTLLDIDALASAEQENWVWGGASFLPHAGVRCLVSLSRGGGDAHVVREFDTVTRAFVEDGFVLPEAKGGASWVDADTVTVATDFGPGSMTSSGYPRQVKLWRRGQPLAQASLLLEVAESDLSVGAYHDFTPGYEHDFIERQIDFYTSELFLRRGENLIRIDKPLDANAYTVHDQLVIELRSDWTLDGHTWPQGALLATPFEDFLAGQRHFDLLFEPSPTRSLDSVTMTHSAILITELDDVRNRIVELRRVDGRWLRRRVVAPEFGALGVNALDPYGSDQYFLTVTDFLHPTTLTLGEVGTDVRRTLTSMPAFFDAAPYTVEQHMAISSDGERIPYFVVMPQDAEHKHDNPTLLYGYGGFEISLTPFYSGVTGAAWLEQGGVYVLANIRGGGEFGPRWHQAALKEHRQRAFDDFYAVAEDLVARGITTAAHLGIMGGSNGGLLVGTALTQRPELFKAVVCQVPLLDMRRYNKLLAGASWVGEYGDPDNPDEWAYIGAYSPYQNVRAGQQYPRTFFTTSTRDDRVHPGHARKMVARMGEQGHDVLYWENTEGGHAGAANNDQTAQMWALTYTFLLQQLR